MNCNAQDITLSVPSDLLARIDTAIGRPPHRVHRKAADNLRWNLFYQLYRAICHRTGTVVIHQGLMDAMWGTRHRKQLVGCLKTTRVLWKCRSHVAGKLSTQYAVSPMFSLANSMTVPSYMVPPDAPATCFHPVWNPLDNATTVYIPGIWITELSSQYEKAAKKLWGQSSKYRRCLRWSLKSTRLDAATNDLCQEAARESYNRLTTTQKKSAWPVDQRATLYDREWSRFQAAPMAFCFRQDGRLYWPLVNQAKYLRRRLIRFNVDGKSVPAAEVDLSGSYWLFLATMLKEGCPQLINDIEAGTVYESLSDACRSQSYPDRKQLKIAAQVQCLFGRTHYGRQPLFGAMQTIYPELARYLEQVRFRNGSRLPWGARELARMLTMAEGSWFIDGLLSDLRRAKIPALPVHDAVVVPLTDAACVKQLAEAKMVRDFGIRAPFKIEGLQR